MARALAPSIRHIAGVAALTLGLLWPAVWMGAPLAFFDTEAYYNGGGIAVRYFMDQTGLAASPDTADGTATGAPATDAQIASVRSVPYSVFVNLAVRGAGLFGPVILAAAGTAWLIWLALAPLAVVGRLVAGAALVTLTTVGFFASQVMPDIFAAWLILIPVILARRPRIGNGIALLMGLVAFAAILFHYSHIPLAAAMGGTLALWLLRQRRWRAALLVQLPLLLAMAVNIGISAVLPGKISLAPGRLPILLARSLEDGVALRYLTEHCATADFTICEIYDSFPTTVAEAMWQGGNIRQRATPGQMARITNEEIALILAVFRYDPAAQTRALLRNAADQFTRIGLYEMRSGTFEISGPMTMRIGDLSKVRDEFRWLTLTERVVLLASAPALLLLVLRLPRARLPIVLLLIGLITNALVCGGLSAPADRYQGRIAWLALLVLLIYLPDALPRRWSAERGPP